VLFQYRYLLAVHCFVIVLLNKIDVHCAPVIIQVLSLLCTCDCMVFSYVLKIMKWVGLTETAICRMSDWVLSILVNCTVVGDIFYCYLHLYCECWCVFLDICRRNDADRIQSWETSYNCDSDTYCLKRRENEDRRKVTFADAAGLALSKIQVIQEASDDPPDLRSYVMQNCVNNEHVNKLTSNQSASHLVVNFSQPAASYMSFREKVMTDCVSLENVVVRDNFKLVGTVKVKNIACNKAVTIRCTFDSWSSYQDFAAKPVSSEQLTFGLFVTFTFEVIVPSSVSTKKGAVQFAVYYLADGQEFWDNNCCQNYVIDIQSEVSHKQSAYSGPLNTRNGSRDTGASARRDSVYSFESSTSWSEFAGWSDLVSESPYW